MKPTLYVDKHCSTCRRWGRFIAFFLCGNRVNIRPISYRKNDKLIARYMRKNQSWALVVAGNWYAHIDAFIQLVAISHWARWMAPVLRFRPFRWCGLKVYRFISSHRTCSIPKK